MKREAWKRVKLLFFPLCASGSPTPPMVHPPQVMLLSAQVLIPKVAALCPLLSPTPALPSARPFPTPTPMATQGSRVPNLGVTLLYYPKPEHPFLFSLYAISRGSVIFSGMWKCLLSFRAPFLVKNRFWNSYIAFSSPYSLRLRPYLFRFPSPGFPPIFDKICFLPTWRRSFFLADTPTPLFFQTLR